MFICVHLWLLTLSAHAAFPLAGANLQRTGHVNASAPTTDPVIAWERPLGIVGESSTQPIIDAEGNVYVTAAPSGNNTEPLDGTPSGTLVSYDPNGTLRWRYDWTWDASKPGRTAQLAVPALAPDDRIVMGFRFGWFRCWNKDSGDLLWERDLSAGTKPITSSTAVDPQGYAYVYVRDIPAIHKIDVNTGDFEYVARIPDGGSGTMSSPSFSRDGQTLYVGRGAHGSAYLRAMDARDGSPRWAWSPETSGVHSFAWSIPIVDEAGTVYIQDEESASLYAIEELVQTPHLKWAYKRQGLGAPRVAALDERALYSSYNNPAPVVFAVDRAGNELWSVALPGESAIGGLVVTPQALYFAVNGAVYALDKSSGATLWSKRISPQDASFSEGPAIADDGTIYIGTNGTESNPNQATLVALRTK